MQVRRYLFGLVLLTFVVSCGDGRRPAFVDADDTSPPVRGGTLKVVGFSDVDHLASTGAYSTSSMGLLWILTRQLVTYPLSEDFATATKVAPDLAEILPTLENGGISADGRTYTFHFRRGVLWNTTPPREVNAHDLVRGLKLICNPVVPAGAPGYYTSNDHGYGRPTAMRLRRFLEPLPTSNVLSRAATSKALRRRMISPPSFTWYSPASDFLNILGDDFASPVPVEYLEYLPDSPDFRRTRSPTVRIRL